MAKAALGKGQLQAQKHILPFDIHTSESL